MYKQGRVRIFNLLKYRRQSVRYPIFAIILIALRWSLNKRIEAGEWPHKVMQYCNWDCIKAKYALASFVKHNLTDSSKEKYFYKFCLPGNQYVYAKVNVSLRKYQEIWRFQFRHLRFLFFRYSNAIYLTITSLVLWKECYLFLNLIWQLMPLTDRE
jgi:hypothetical protein